MKEESHRAMEPNEIGDMAGLDFLEENNLGEDHVLTKDALQDFLRHKIPE